MTAKSIKKALLILAGTLSLILGIVGLFIPLLPTTPFLLLSSFCYIRSSKRLYNWLIKHKLFGSFIHNYLTNRAIKQSAKIGTLIFLWVSLGASICIVNNLHMRIFLFVVGVGVSIHIFTLKKLGRK